MKTCLFCQKPSEDDYCSEECITAASNFFTKEDIEEDMQAWYDFEDRMERMSEEERKDLFFV